MKTKEIIDFLPNNVASSVLSDQDFGIAGMSDERLVALWKKSPLESFREAVLGEDSYTLNWGKPCQHCGSSTFQKDGVLYCSHCNKKTVECSCKRQESLDLRLVQFRKSLYFELKERNLIEDIGKKSKDKKRYVYGTRDKRWHLVGPEDRDYESGLSPEQFEKLGPEKSKELYLKPALLRTESEEDLSDWIEAGFTPEEAKKWIKSGFEPYGSGETILSVAKRWKKYGFDPDSAKAWWNAFGLAGGVPSWIPAEFREWIDSGIDDPVIAGNWNRKFRRLKDVKKWIKRGYRDPSEVPSEKHSESEFKDWFAAGFEDEKEIEDWRGEGFDDPHEAMEWNKMGFYPVDAATWRDAGFGSEEAKAWYEEGFGENADYASKWRQHFNPAEARAWYDAHFDYDEAEEWASSGFEDPSEASSWKNAGFTPEEAKKWIKRGYGDPSQVPKGEIGESKNLVKFYCKTCNKGFEAKEFTRHQSHDWKIEQLEHESVEEIVNDLLGEKSPPGFEGTVKAMKKYKDIDNPWALAWWMKKKGYKSHKGKK
jgi:hypothetical protein